MRQRKLKNLDEKLARYAALVETDPALWRGRWRENILLAAAAAQDGTTKNTDMTSPEAEGTEASPARPAEGTVTPAAADAASAEAAGKTLYAEIGCGKGQFISRTAAAHPENLYLAVEGNESVAYYALRKAHDAGVSNVRFLLSYIHDAADVFGEAELDGIYLNFSDPWPKTRHEKRRLTAGNYLSEYARAVKHGGFIEFRTDNDPLFDFSLRQAELQEKMTVETVSRDLHRDTDPETLITTEYEDKFASMGKNINFLRMRVK